ncbi:aldo/keto reductase [Arthrobacter sp. U41]|uniref:aldo/keto reductase n=1 Tax=Arthrobacter sp. U41 TaxID=1849032 RepID=UPI001E3BEE4B|nr:aldo/keto reductase [Arthrobacter sp. U41]
MTIKRRASPSRAIDRYRSIQVALAWVLRNPAVTAPIVGATKTNHLTDAAAALDIRLTDEQAHTLEKAYTASQPATDQSTAYGAPATGRRTPRTVLLPPARRRASRVPPPGLRSSGGR